MTDNKAKCDRNIRWQQTRIKIGCGGSLDTERTDLIAAKIERPISWNHQIFVGDTFRPQGFPSTKGDSNCPWVQLPRDHRKKQPGGKFGDWVWTWPRYPEKETLASEKLHWFACQTSFVTRKLSRNPITLVCIIFFFFSLHCKLIALQQQCVSIRSNWTWKRSQNRPDTEGTMEFLDWLIPVALKSVGWTKKKAAGRKLSFQRHKDIGRQCAFQNCWFTAFCKMAQMLLQPKHQLHSVPRPCVLPRPRKSSKNACHPLPHRSNQ